MDNRRAKNFTMKKFSISKVNVHAVQSKDAVNVVLSWFKEPKKFHYISSTNINNVINAVESEYFLEVTNNADLSLPDGMPLIWHGRRLGYKLPKRCGIAELMYELFELSNKGHDFRHYFYGNTQEVLNDLKKELLTQYPNLTIAGMYSPPFRQISVEEDNEIVQKINEAKPDFLWVSLGCPKQEIWLYEHRAVLDVVAGGGAGSVFNFISKHSIEAPKWVQYAGLEWLLRLITSPGKLYKRYLFKYPKFFLTCLRSNLRYIKH
jgi:N-acetylglucosaminyldiphosphoundecaprenol N-acetyl-beta-D-mannosaminyltransferase